MNTKYCSNIHERLRRLLRRSGMILLALAVVVLTSASAVGRAESTDIGSREANAALAPDVPELSSRLITVTSGKRGEDLLLEEGTSVMIRHEDTVLTVTSGRERISALLERLQVFPGPLEAIGVKISGSVVELEITSELAYKEYVQEPDAYETIRQPNPDMDKGEERVIQAGADGLRTVVYEVVWSNGKELSREFVEALEGSAVDEIIEYGTGETAARAAANRAAAYTRSAVASVSRDASGGTLRLKDGTTLYFSEAMRMTATAYTTGYDGVGTITASGTTVHVGVVAVDRRVIPLGTRLFVVTDSGFVYGLSAAEDTGVFGQRVDLYLNSYPECVQFGVQGCTVYLLE